MFQYRVTKYDPRFRDRRGAYLPDDWISISEIGESFSGIVLTREAYQLVADAYIETVVSFLTEAGVALLCCVDVENHGQIPGGPVEGQTVQISHLSPIMRDVLRGEYWCRFESETTFVHFGYDYYMHVGVPTRCGTACERAHQHGLFVEPFLSPYHRAAE